MSHTFTGDEGTIFHYNSDLSGDVTVYVPWREGNVTAKMQLPAKDILQFVAEQLRDRQIERTESSDWQNFVDGLGRD